MGIRSAGTARSSAGGRARRADALRRVEALVREDLAEFPNPTRDEVEALRQEARS